VLDPVGAFDAIRNDFLLYLKTAFGTRFIDIEVERASLLDQPGALSQELWLETLPTYLSSGKTIGELDENDLPGLNAVQRKNFVELVGQGLFPPERKNANHCANKQALRCDSRNRIWQNRKFFVAFDGESYT
jgi:DEAD/DEAH box helicase domain-containing protein